MKTPASLRPIADAVEKAFGKEETRFHFDFAVSNGTELTVINSEHYTALLREVAELKRIREDAAAGLTDCMTDAEADALRQLARDQD